MMKKCVYFIMQTFLYPSALQFDCKFFLYGKFIVAISSGTSEKMKSEMEKNIQFHFNLMIHWDWIEDGELWIFLWKLLNDSLILYCGCWIFLPRFVRELNGCCCSCIDCVSWKTLRWSGLSDLHDFVIGISFVWWFALSAWLFV